jgi:hypothetical protein
MWIWPVIADSGVYPKNIGKHIRRVDQKCFHCPCQYERLGVTTLESETCVELNLAPSADGSEYSGDVVGKTTRWIREHSVSIPSQRERALRVTRNCKIRMIEEIVGFRSEGKPRTFGQLEALLKRHIKLREPRSAQDISSSIAKLLGRGCCKCSRIKPA